MALLPYPWPPEAAQYVTLILPVNEPAVCGVKETERFALCCELKVIGRLGPTKAKAVPDMETFTIFNFDFPVLVTVAGMIRLLPTCTLPKLTF